MLKQILSWFFILAMTLQVNAAHLVGGEIFYECLGGNEYLITLKVYRDCFTVTGAEFDNPANIAVYDDAGNLVTNLTAPYTGSQQIPVIINNPCLQAPPNVCVEEAVYTVTATLPFISGGYHVAYQRCCRNPTIINLVNPDELGSTYYVQIPEQALSSCNSSPYFNSFPPIALCTGDELIFDHSATDPEGDQLIYSLCTPYHGGDQNSPMPVPPLGPPYSNIVWGGGYSSGYPLTSSPPLTIDPQTGLLTGVPTQPGQFVVGVCVEEYRNGQLLSVNKRDFQFNVVNCESNIEAVIPTQPVFHDPCDGLTVSFGNNSINAQFYRWDFGVDGIFTDTSGLENPVFTFPDTGTYAITLIANPGFPCADTTIDDIAVYLNVEAAIESTGEQCFDENSIDFEAVGTFGSGATFAWEFENATPSTSTVRNPVGVEFDTVGVYQVRLQVTEGICSAQANATIEMYPRPQPYFSGQPVSGCAPLGVFLFDSSNTATPHQSFWNLGDGTEVSGDRVFHGYSEPGLYDITLTIWTESGCVDTVSFTITDAVEVYPLPSGELTVDTNIRFVYDPIFSFSGNSSGSVCDFYPGDGSFYPDSCSMEYFYTDTGDYRAVMVFTDENGCVVSDSVTVRVEPEVRFWVANAFTPNGDRINDTWGPNAYGFSEYELWVFDRWGQLMFHSTDPFEKWNGTLSNKGNRPALGGVYSYRIVARSVKSTVVREFGHVTIVK